MHGVSATHCASLVDGGKTSFKGQVNLGKGQQIPFISLNANLPPSLGRLNHFIWCNHAPLPLNLDRIGPVPIVPDSLGPLTMASHADMVPFGLTLIGIAFVMWTTRLMVS